MSNIREVLENCAIDYHSTIWDDEDGGGSDSEEQKRLLDEAELAINKIMEAKFKENYKRLALDVIGEDESTTIVIKATSPIDLPDKLLLERRLNRNDLRQKQRATLSDQLNNMKGE